MSTQAAIAMKDLRPKEIAELARKQAEGGFTAESDALTALYLIEALALRLAEVTPTPPNPLP